jgi:hypothetical protein
MNRNIPAAPAHEPMFADTQTLAQYMRGLTFHPDDVPIFGIPEAREFMQEILCDEFGWTRSSYDTTTWGDSSTPVRFEIWVGGQNTIKLSEFEGNSLYPVRVTDFTGELRTMFPRALAYISTLQGA